MNAYIFIIGLCIVVIASFFFNILAKKTNIPSVLMLIFTGVALNQLLLYIDIEPDFFSTLEILGIVGLIMIVLEAALDLELKKDKWPVIWKSFLIALILLVLTSLALSFIIQLFIPSIEFLPALLYAIPLSIMSSAIIIPSVTNLRKDLREFLIYESTFSDILGIMIFYMIVENLDTENARQLTFAIGSNIVLTIVISVVLSYALLYIIQNIKGDAKFFLFLSVLVLLYAIGKMFHLSSLIIILMFGLLLGNHKIILNGFLDRWLDDEKIDGVFDQFKMITVETAFLVRTFFFVVFGMTLPLSELLNLNVWFISITFLIVTYALRFGAFKLFDRNESIITQTLVAPRGLITVLLFFAIPEEMRNENFQSGVLFLVIIATSLIMAWGLIFSNKKSVLNKMKLPKDMSEKEKLKIDDNNFNESVEIPKEVQDSIDASKTSSSNSSIIIENDSNIKEESR